MTPERPYFHEVAGDNLRMSNLLASVGIGQMVEIEYIKKIRLKIYERYVENLRQLDPACFIVPTDAEGFFPWGVGIRIIDKYRATRDEIVEALQSIGVETRPGFSSASSLPYSNEFPSNHFPVADLLAEQVLLLPHYPELTFESVDQICQIILAKLL